MSYSHNRVNRSLKGILSSNLVLVFNFDPKIFYLIDLILKILKTWTWASKNKQNFLRHSKYMFVIQPLVPFLFSSVCVICDVQAGSGQFSSEAEGEDLV